MKKLEEKGEKKEDMEKKKEFLLLSLSSYSTSQKQHDECFSEHGKKNVRNKEQTPT